MGHPMRDDAGTPADTAAPARNFTLSLDERLRAFAQGVPSHLRRRRRIEDLEQRIVRALRAAAGGAVPAEVVADLATLNDLIDRHNRYYPIEARLPIDLRTHALLDHGRPWRPLPLATLAELTARAREPVNS